MAPRRRAPPAGNDRGLVSVDRSIRARIGVFGGTFDPPHVGHLIVAHDAAEALGLDRLLLVLAARPPHKPAERYADPGVRLEMLRAAVEGDPLLEASDLELERPGPSYTVDTLRAIEEGHPDAELHLLVGVDQWRELGSWKEPRELARLATIVVMARAGEDPSRLDPGIGVVCRAVPVTRIDLSSSEVRARVRAGRSVRHLVPAAVEEIIRVHALYRAPTRVATAETSR
jgi:nicotinate-nucleotide adenylyltransferase